MLCSFRFTALYVAAPHSTSSSSHGAALLVTPTGSQYQATAYTASRQTTIVFRWNWHIFLWHRTAWRSYVRLWKRPENWQADCFYIVCGPSLQVGKQKKVLFISVCYDVKYLHFWTKWRWGLLKTKECKQLSIFWSYYFSFRLNPYLIFYSILQTIPIHKNNFVGFQSSKWMRGKRKI